MERLFLIDFENLEFIHPKMRELLAWIHDQEGWQVITSLYRIGDDGVHGTLPLRAVDLRANEIEGKTLENLINGNWQYDPGRLNMKVAIFHDIGQGPHLHLQVHENTKRFDAD